MQYNTISKKYAEMLTMLEKLAGEKFDSKMPEATIMTMHRAGRLVWKLYWNLQIRNETRSPKGPGKWRYRLQVTPGFNVHRLNARLDREPQTDALKKAFKKHIELLKMTGPYFKGISGTNLDHINNGKDMLWGQISMFQKYYSTMRRLTREDFEKILDESCPPAFKALIEAQK